MMPAWKHMSLREQRLLVSMVFCILVGGLFTMLWQPARQRLEISENQYQQQLLLATQLQRAIPRTNLSGGIQQPLSLRISQSVALAGLELQQMGVDDDVLRLVVSGNAQTLLQWLGRTERDGVVLQSLTLEKRDSFLVAQVVLR